jgi:hypothetical protein
LLQAYGHRSYFIYDPDPSKTLTGCCAFIIIDDLTNLGASGCNVILGAIKKRHEHVSLEMLAILINDWFWLGPPNQKPTGRSRKLQLT